MPNSESPSLTTDQAMQRAVALHRGGQLQAAADLYRAILQAQPGHADANHNLGTLALQTGQPAAGLPFFKAALENQPGNPQHWLSYIEVLIQTAQLDAARSVLEQGRQHGLQGDAVDALALRAAGGAPPAGLEAALAHREAGRHQEALATTRLWLDGHADDAGAHALLAHLLLSLKQVGEAGKAMHSALALNPALPVVQRNHARLLLAQQRLADALRAAQAAYDADRADPENQTMLAATLIANNQPAAAEALLASALLARPRYAEAYVNRAHLKLAGGDVNGALADVHQALAIKPHLAPAWAMAVSLYHRLKDNRGAAAALEKYLALEPDDVRHLMYLGQLKHLDGKAGEALPLFTRATELAPDNAGAWTNLGMVLHEMKQIDQAKLCYAKALELAPGQAEVANNLGALALSEGALADAQRYFKLAIQAKPGLGEAHLNLGHALSDLHQTDAALAAYGAAMAANAGDGSAPRAALYMAILYYIGGDLENCAAHLVHAKPLMDSADGSDRSDKNYWAYLARLLAWHQQHPDAGGAGAAGILYVVGESHSLATQRMQVNYRGRTLRCAAQWLPGAKQWHLGAGSAYRSQQKFESVVARLPRGSTLLLCIGEIDCRHDEGILPAWKKRPEQPLAAVMQRTVDAYLARLATVRARYDHRMIICGVPATNADLSRLSAGEREQFLGLIRDFNRYLRQQALAAGHDFLDVYALTDRGDGVAGPAWHLDPVHLLPSALAVAFEQHLHG
ncbi:tetratricopeptide repeat containing protein [Janthinobacterium sp. HH01]|uniref:tetratricopeptide repeat protein n=1 Tax=Janthinobacterium sp. HH01 TaxID=1198452 RepID=UPI0002AECDF3|nr:tetratricopeptide repeat protein [Janthinobacterium sp. HH01]ELX10617.1 tetratricopeptide repeat containing protein [Janthinobacterium sp. HH01]